MPEVNDGMSVKEIKSQFIDLHRDLLESRKENKQLQDKLDYVKSLVESNRVGHAVKFDLQMMFKGDEE